MNARDSNKLSVTQRFDRMRQTHVKILAGDGLRLEVGSMRDYHALAEFHYRSQHPGTATRVWVLRHDHLSSAARFAGREGSQSVAGVLVESLPSLACRMRDWALHERYRSITDVRARARLLCDELRVVSRVVVHPQWRGLGLAVRLVRATLENPVTRYTEAIAAMGHVNPFFEVAGMRAYPRPPHPFDQRLRDAFSSAGINPVELAAIGPLGTKIDNMPEHARRWFVREVRTWFARTHRTSRIESTLTTQLELARQRLLCEPVYYLFDHASHPSPGASPS
ncbi:MAG: hypothetical protein GC164_02725 [Phycisphaera sp.]|nr:hypothetical protein [Phycisphaera sp.]